MNIALSKEKNMLSAGKFSNQFQTAKGEQRAWVEMAGLKTLWFNTGTLCNIACINCYIESSPTNDALVYLTLEEVQSYLDEIARLGSPTEEIGFTGGEPFMNRQFPAMLSRCLSDGFRVLVLTNAMKPMWHKREALLSLKETYGTKLALRVSLDHYTQQNHEAERGANTWAPAMQGLKWLAQNGFNIAVAGRTCFGEDEATARQGYASLFAAWDIPCNADDPARLMLFPEMEDAAREAEAVPEITTACWQILDVAPQNMMCASARMVVKRKGADAPSVVACTLLPYSPEFEMGQTLSQSLGDVHLNHPHCARFCVLGGASCSA